VTELIVRLIASGILVLVSGWLGTPSFAIVTAIGGFVLSYAPVAFWMESKQKLNPGSAGLMCALDCFSIAAILGATGQLTTLGFTVALPVIWASSKHQAPAVFTAPISACALLTGFGVFERIEPAPTFYVAVVAILGLGWFLKQPKAIAAVPQKQEQFVGKVEPLGATEPEGTLELRESFRQLRTLYRDLARKGRREHWIAALLRIRFPNGERFYGRLAQEIQRLTGAEGVLIHTVALFDHRFVVRAVEGEFSRDLAESTFVVDPEASTGQIKHRIEKAILASEPNLRGAVANFILQVQGRPIGMMTVRFATSEALDEYRNDLEEVASVIAELTEEEERRNQANLRLGQAELLYDVAATIQGAETPTSLSSRVVRRLAELMDADHVGVYWLDGMEILAAHLQGAKVDLLSALQFADGTGLSGWLRMGAPELVAYEAATDRRVDLPEMMKRRVGSFALFPIRNGADVIGFTLATTRMSGGLDVPNVESMRLITYELERGLGELSGNYGDGEGLVTAAEFASLVHQGGMLVILDPLKRDTLLEQIGKPMFDHALRQLATRVRTRLPAGGAICKRAQGDLVVFLRDAREEEARAWANEVAALASLIGIRMPDGSPIPMGIRATVSLIEVHSAVPLAA
jgi:hypothetical protein